MKTPRRLTVLGFVTAGALGAAACGGTAATASGRPAQHRTAKTQQVTITGNSQFRFSPSTVRVHTGYVRITLKDMGAYPHNIVIPALKVSSASVSGDPGGNTVSFTVDFRSKGRFPFHCEYHQSAGMVGNFVVS